MTGVHYYRVDLTDLPSIETAAEQVRRDHGHPSVLINNAGIGKFPCNFTPNMFRFPSSSIDLTDLRILNINR